MVSSSEGEHPGGCPRKMSPWKPRCGITFKGNLLELLETEQWPTRSRSKNNLSGLKSTALYMLAYLLRRPERETKGGKQALPSQDSNN